MRKSRSSVSSSRSSLQPADQGSVPQGRLQRRDFLQMARQVPRMDVPHARLLRDLEAENNKLKKLLAEVHLDIHALNTAFGVRGKALAP